MKSKLTKLLPVRQVCLAAGGLFVLSGLNSCKMPAEPGYAKADWSVQTSVTREDYPVGVSLEDISDEPMPSEEEIALGLPSHSGNAQANNPWASGALKTDSQGRVAKLPLNQEILAPVNADEPPMPGTGPGDGRSHRLSDPLVGRAEPTLPTPHSTTPPEEIKPASVHSTPENLALMASASVRPYLPPRGPAVPEAQAAAPTASATPGTPLPAAATPAPASIASASPVVNNQAAPAPDDLVEILKLAKKVEAGRKR